MSPSTLRRYRAERLLRQEFAGLREDVLRSVRGRLRVRGVHLDGGDLEACYAAAWQGLYAAVAAGDEIDNPGGWLSVVTFRRAIDEHRSARSRGFGDPAYCERAHSELPHAERAATHRERATVGAAAGSGSVASAESDFAAELDDRARLRQLFEALRSRLTARECELASLCYLQGLTRAQAAQRMGISEARMTKLMEGRGPGRPGVASKVGELLEAIRGGQWCEQQGSLMRGFAFGILDPRGERYRLARLHQRECPACRAYVLSLRGLAAVLPPLPLPWGVGLSPLPHAGANVGASAKAGAGGGAVAGGGVAAASGAAGAGGAAGGGWLLGGSVGAKLAVGCLLALSVGCVAVATAPHVDGADRSHPRRKAPSSAYVADAPNETGGPASLAASADLGGSSLASASSKSLAAARRNSATARAAALRHAAEGHALREFGLERPTAAVPAASSSARSAPVSAHVASAQRTGAGESDASVAESASASPAAPIPAPRGPPSHAEREFGPE